MLQFKPLIQPLNLLIMIINLILTVKLRANRKSTVLLKAKMASIKIRTELREEEDIEEEVIIIIAEEVTIKVEAEAITKLEVEATMDTNREKEIRR